MQDPEDAHTPAKLHPLPDAVSPAQGLLVPVLLQAWQRARTDAAHLPATAWRRWALTLLVGYAAAWGVVLVTVHYGRRWVDQGLQGWDESLLRGLAASDFTFPMGLWFEAWGSSAFLIPMLAVAVVLLARGGYPLRALTLLVAYVSIKGLVLGAWQLWDRPRPEFVAGGIAAPGLHSYPSGHAVNSVVLFGLLGAWWWQAARGFWERALALLVPAAVVILTCLGRIRIGTHWPSDVIAGTLIGLAWLVGSVLAVALAERAAPDTGDRNDQAMSRSDRMA